jgi:uncharacterized membrane protein YebE (DUF533 family)
MAGFMDMLGSMINQGMSQTGRGRISHALGGSGNLNDIMGNLTAMMSGGSGAPSSSAAGGRGGALPDILGQLANNKMAVGGLGALAGALLGGGGGGAARGAVGGGGLAMLASLAFSALQQAGQQPADTPRGLLEPQNEQESQALENDAELIVKAMINAAKADGNIDEGEIERIIGKMQEDGLTEEEKQFFQTEAAKPIDIESIAAPARGDAELAAQVYAASLLAIEVDTDAERHYLQQLSTALNLSPQVTAIIHQSLGVPG